MRSSQADSWQSMTWEDIYEHWSRNAKDYSPALLDPLPAERNYAWFLRDYKAFEFDWRSRREHKDAQGNLVDFYMSSNKGTKHTVEMLANTKDAEERAAIWIYAFLQDYSKLEMEGRGNAIVHEMLNHVGNFLSSRFDMWHRKMTKLLPDSYFDYGLCYFSEFLSFEPLVELALASAAMVLSKYKATVMTAVEVGQIPGINSIRLDEMNFMPLLCAEQPLPQY